MHPQISKVLQNAPWQDHAVPVPMMSPVPWKNVTPWRKTDRSHGGKFHDHGHFVYKPLKHVQNLGTKELSTPLARSLQSLIATKYFWIQNAQQISLQIAAMKKIDIPP
jgi:hypothetical protein